MHGSFEIDLSKPHTQHKNAQISWWINLYPQKKDPHSKSPQLEIYKIDFSVNFMPGFRQLALFGHFTDGNRNHYGVFKHGEARRMSVSLAPGTKLLTFNYYSSLANNVDYDLFEYFSRNEDMSFAIKDEDGVERVFKFNRVQFAAKSTAFADLADYQIKEGRLFFENISFTALVLWVVYLKTGRTSAEHVDQIKPEDLLKLAKWAHHWESHQMMSFIEDILLTPEKLKAFRGNDQLVQQRNEIASLFGRSGKRLRRLLGKGNEENYPGPDVYDYSKIDAKYSTAEDGSFTVDASKDGSIEHLACEADIHWTGKNANGTLEITLERKTRKDPVFCHFMDGKEFKQRLFWPNQPETIVLGGGSGQSVTFHYYKSMKPHYDYDLFLFFSRNEHLEIVSTDLKVAGTINLYQLISRSKRLEKEIQGELFKKAQAGLPLAFEALRVLVHFMKTGRVFEDEIQKWAPRLLEFADEYGIAYLVPLCNSATGLAEG